MKSGRFRSFDSDGDGLWSPSELRTALRSSGQEVGLQDIQKLMETTPGKPRQA